MSTHCSKRVIRIMATATILLTLVIGCGPSQSTDTPVPPTDTPLPPTDTPQPTHTPVPPTLVPTSIPPTATPHRSSVPMGEPVAAPISFVDSGQRLGNASSWAVSLGDVDGDGDLDALVGNNAQAGAGSALWLNAGGAQGGTPGVFDAGGQDLGNADGLELGDVDGDGDLDAFIVNARGPGKVWLNDGAGVFDDSGQRLNNAYGFGVALGDVDGDGDLDAFVESLNANTVWLNQGGAQGGAPGVFDNSGQRLGSAITADVALGDLDGDGDLDALAGGWDEAAKVWLNKGGAQGGTPGVFVHSGRDLSPATVHIHGLALGDVDGDGDLDALMAIASGHPNQVWLGDGTGSLDDSGQELSSGLAHGVSLGDLDGDGDLDAFMVTGNQGGSPNVVWVNQGGVLSDSGLRLGNASSLGVALGDLDGDGDLDAFVANATFSDPPTGMHNTVWLNDMFAPATTSAPTELQRANFNAETQSMLNDALFLKIGALD